ncbi:MAG: hypothetical protein ACI837_000845, partial [Crocinitomicaceae bacterium]
RNARVSPLSASSSTRQLTTRKMRLLQDYLKR